MNRVRADTTVTVATEVLITWPLIGRNAPLWVKLPFHVVTKMTAYTPGCRYVCLIVAWGYGAPGLLVEYMEPSPKDQINPGRSATSTTSPMMLTLL